MLRGLTFFQISKQEVRLYQTRNMFLHAYCLLLRLFGAHPDFACIDDPWSCARTLTLSLSYIPPGLGIVYLQVSNVPGRILDFFQSSDNA